MLAIYVIAGLVQRWEATTATVVLLLLLLPLQLLLLQLKVTPSLPRTNCRQETGCLGRAREPALATFHHHQPASGTG